MAAPFPGRLLATSDLHISHRKNRAALDSLGRYPDDWLIVAGDIGEKPEHLEIALDAFTSRFARVIWTAGNHDLWKTGPSGPSGPSGSRNELKQSSSLSSQSPQTEKDARLNSARHVEPAGPEGPEGPTPSRYEQLVAICRARDVVTPEDPYLEWPGAPNTFIVPMLLLFDYSFRPPDVTADGAIPWARKTGVVSGDEQMLDPAPWPSIGAWCRARCDVTAARLDALPAGSRTVLVNHWPLRYDLARPPRVPRFSIWCGTTRTEDWGQRYRAVAVVSGHLHLRTTMWRHGVRYEEVSLGYPRDWRAERGIDWYLREILPGAGRDAQRFVPPFDPFR